MVVISASSGIGAAASRRLHQLGARVVPVGRDPERTAAITADVAEDRIEPPFTVDFSRLDTVHLLAEQLLAHNPRIDVLASNAGVTVPERTITVDGHGLTGPDPLSWTR